MSAFWGHKRVLDFPLKMGLGANVTYLVLVLGTKLSSSRRATSALNHFAFFSPSRLSFFPEISWQLESLLVLYLKVFSLYFLLVVAEFQV